MILLGVSVLLIESVNHLLVLSLEVSTDGDGFLSIWMLYGFSAWYLLCFVFLGVTGLWVFRKKR